MTAECGIGPATGTYQGHVPAPAGPAVTAMAVGDHGFGGDFVAALEACQPPNTLCEGQPGTPGAGYWVCCEPNTPCAVDAQGRPLCGP
ncbi:hypothetical protein AB0J52_35665 [Spirillospora sp. NPDC049652]